MLGTHPDISYAVIKMAQFASNPSLDHMNKAKQIIRYFGSSPDLSLVFDGGMSSSKDFNLTFMGGGMSELAL